MQGMRVGAGMGLVGRVRLFLLAAVISLAALTSVRLRYDARIVATTKEVDDTSGIQPYAKFQPTSSRAVAPVSNMHAASTPSKPIVGESASHDTLCREMSLAEWEGVTGTTHAKWINRMTPAELSRLPCQSVACPDCNAALSRFIATSRILGTEMTQGPGNDGRRIYFVSFRPGHMLPGMQAGRQYLAKFKFANDLLPLYATRAATASTCGLSHLEPRHWVARLDAILPGTGVRLHNETAIIVEYIPNSIAGTVFQHRCFSEQTCRLDSLNWEKVKGLFKRVNSTLVRDAALYDLLIGVKDRNGGGVMFLEDGNFNLIDSELSFFPQPDSIFVTGSKYWHKILNRPYQGVVSPLRTLDYRCHMANNIIGAAFPPQFIACLLQLRDGDAATVAEVFSLAPHLAAGSRLHMQQRAAQLLSLGYEATLELIRFHSDAFSLEERCDVEVSVGE
eukprot:jgi/Chlat1/4097/Chrsp26S04145